MIFQLTVFTVITIKIDAIKDNSINFYQRHKTINILFFVLVLNKFLSLQNVNYYKLSYIIRRPVLLFGIHSYVLVSIIHK